VNVVLMGPPGAGKGTQAARLAARHEMLYIATGNILRAAVHSGTTLGKQVADVLSSGQLVSDELMVGLIRNRLEQDDARRGWLMDGFPRTVAQAEALRQLLDELDQTIHAVVVMEVPHEVLIARLAGRLNCRACGATTSRQSLADGDRSPCPACGERALFVRNDDQEETVRERLEVYQRQTDPVVAVLRRLYPLRQVSGLGTPQEVAERLHGVLG
jgi:adenylate kinase